MLLDYELIGDLQVSNGIVSGFNNSTNNYIKIPYSLPMGSNKVEACISVYIPAFSSMSVILANYNDASSGRGLGLRTDGDYNNLKYWAWNSSGTLVAEGIDLGFDLTIGTNIIKFIYKNSTITWYKSTDGTNFTQGVSRSGTIADFKNYIAIGASGTVWSSGNMQVNILDSYIKVNDEYWHSKEYIKQKTKIVQRHDTAANWTSVNPVLAAGEMGVETDTNKFKFGDGVTAWSSLAYAAGEGGGGGTTLTSTDGTTTYSKLALGDNLVVDPGDIAWTNPQITSNSQDGYVASASTSASPSNGPYRAFDKDITGQDLCWYTGSVSMPQWIMLECPEPVRLTSCMIMNEVKTPESFKSGYIQGSNDGSTFDTLYTITDRASTAGLQTTYQIDTNKYYKYLRVYCTATSGNGLSIQEIEFKGFIKDASAVPSLNVNLDELGNEVNTLANTKQNKLTAVAPIQIYSEGQYVLNGTMHGGTLSDDFIYKAGSGTYIELPEFYNLSTADTWEFATKWTFNGYRTSAILGHTGTTSDKQGPLLLYDGYSELKMLASYAGSSWDISLVAAKNISSDTYYIKTGFNGTQYYLSYSKTGFDNMTTVTASSTTKMYCTANLTLGGYPYNTSAYSSGGIYLEDTSLLMNGSTVYTGVKITDAVSHISSSVATITSLGVVQPDGTSITVSETGVISGQDVKTFTGYSDTGTLVLKSINGVLQWVAE